MKEIKIIDNGVKGIDLIVEKDAGNPVRILTGSYEYSKEFWEQLQEICDIVLTELEYKDK